MLYLLETNWEAIPRSKYGQIEWYEYSYGFVIRAKNEKEARTIAEEEAQKRGNEPARWWLNPDTATCIELDPTGEADIIMEDFHQEDYP